MIMEEAGLRDSLTAAVGSAIGPTAWFQVDQGGIDAFSEAIGSMDAAHKAGGATTGPAPVAQGFYIAGLLPGMLREAFRPKGAGSGMVYGTDKLRFPSFVRPGGRVRLRGVLAQVEASKAAFIASFDVSIEVEGTDKPACVGRLLMRYAPKSHE